MGKTREIKKRIKAVGNIQRITRTMQMIATSKFAKAQNRAVATKPYTEGVFELVTKLAASSGELSHPLVDGPAEGTRPGADELTLIITSDRGLCGPYNANVLRLAMRQVRGLSGDPTTELIGRKGANALKFNGIDVSKQIVVGGEPAFEEIERIAERYMELFVSGEVSAVRVVYMRFISAGRQVPEVLQLLPLKAPTSDEADPEDAGSGNQLYEFSPPAEELLGELLPSTVKATLYQAISDAIVSEHVARMVAMKAATDNAGKMRKLLKRTFNRARQAQITTELSEIISGAAALE